MNKALLIIAVVLIALGVYLWPDEQAAVVHQPDPGSLRLTTAGPIVGYADSHDTYAWLGIPYADAPVGELRWAAPRLPSPWAEPRVATEFGAVCPQLWGMLAGVPGVDGEVVGDEDCLFLNVWSPKGNSDLEDKGLPVMLWIHGGGNTIGSSNTYPAAALAGGEDLVVVTINYRLGFLGWLSHEALRDTSSNARDGSGNYANLDMIMALNWVQNNIASFGGNPDNVTIFGESAGGRNVFSLMASPLAQGLFHQVIAQSGSPATSPLWRAEHYSDANQPGGANSSGEWFLRQLQAAGKAGNREEAKALIASTSAEELMAFARALPTAQVFAGLNGLAGMYPSPQAFRDGTVLPAEPLKQIFGDPAAYNAVPLMTGTNKDETKIFFAQDPAMVEQRFGFLPQVRDPAHYNRLSAYFSDGWRERAVDSVAEAITAGNGAPVYTYRWDWDEGGKNFLVDLSELLGAGHGLEIGFIFDDFENGIAVPGLYNDDNIPGRDALATQMRSYWAQFAYSGDPGSGRRAELPAWTAWGQTDKNLMLLDTEAEGGPRMVADTLTAADLMQRVREDTAFADEQARCAMFAELFWKPNDGDDAWDAAAYEALGCAAYAPWELSVQR